MTLGSKREHWLIATAWQRGFDAEEGLNRDAREKWERGMQVIAEDILLDCPIRPDSYRRGMKRLVGRSLCSECLQQQPALTCFDVNEDDGSCGWAVCDDCLRRMLPPRPPSEQIEIFALRMALARHDGKKSDLAILEAFMEFAGVPRTGGVTELAARLRALGEDDGRCGPECWFERGHPGAHVAAVQASLLRVQRS